MTRRRRRRNPAGGLLTGLAVAAGFGVFAVVFDKWVMTPPAPGPRPVGPPPAPALPAAPSSSMQWTGLPNMSKVQTTPGHAYAVVALVDVPASKVQSIAASYGLQLVNYQDQVDPAPLGLPPAPAGFRYVAGMGNATKSAAVPWEVPWPLSMADSSAMVRAWEGVPS